MRVRSLIASFALLLPAVASGRAQPGLLSSDDPASLRLEAPFEDLFAGARRDPDFEVDGTLAVGGDTSEETAIPVTIALRGHTSRRESECTFPKLKLTAQSGSLPGVGRTLKIGTHCGESPGDELTEKFGRLPNEKSPWREAAVYRILRALEVPTLRTRPARITYVFAPADGSSAAGRTLTRNALLLEDEDEAVDRIGDGDVDPEEFTTADRMFPPGDAAGLAFAEALIGNFDWCVRFFADDTYRCDARHPLWNVIAAKTGDGRARPIVYDFDVSGMVTGAHRWFGDVYNAAFVPSKSRRAVEVIAQLQRTRSLFARHLLDATRRRFVERRDAAYDALESAVVDPSGRRHITEYLDAFYREIDSDAAFYRPVIVAPNTMLKAGPKPGAPVVCASRGPVPPGTPVSDPVDSRGQMIEVVVLDALWHWGSSTRCAPVQRGTAWVDAGAVSRDYPMR